MRSRSPKQRRRAAHPARARSGRIARRSRTATAGWRMGWDSNPRGACTPAGFQDRCLQPLGHPSSEAKSIACRRSSGERYRNSELFATGLPPKQSPIELSDLMLQVRPPLRLGGRASRLSSVKLRPDHKTVSDTFRIFACDASRFLGMKADHKNERFMVRYIMKPLQVSPARTRRYRKPNRRTSLHWSLG